MADNTPSNKKILLLPGDGIGVEVCDEVKRLVDFLGEHHALNFSIQESLVGGACYDKHGVAVTDETVADALHADAVLLGAVGGPQYDNVPREARPEAGLLRLRADMDLFANLRPAVTFDALLDASSLKPEIVRGMNILIVRELTAGVYFGKPRGMQTTDDGIERCIDTQSYTKDEITRVAAVAFDLAGQRSNKVHSVEKANVMETGVFWRKTVSDLHQSAFSQVELHHMYADNCAMQLIRDPKQFDVIVTDNLFGDLLSDAAAMATGSLGMLPSASLGAPDASGRRLAMYEPVHGSAPDIAGQGKANPLATIMSFAMMLRFSFQMDDTAQMIEDAVQSLLNTNIRTPDIATSTSTVVSTQMMGAQLRKVMRNLVG